ncbi:MAG: TetR/AcrR family transcriptional regulator [Pseudomonadota bacterium]
MTDSLKTLYSLRKAPVQARSKATVDAIISAAARILLDAGYDKSSTNKISDLAGVSIGSLYEYFPGKEAIYAELRRREDQRLFDLTMSHPEPSTIQELIRTHIAIYLDFVRSNLELHAAIINDVPQFAVTPDELPFYREYQPWATAFMRTHRSELRYDSNLGRMTDFISRVPRAIIDNYVLNSPGDLQDSFIEDMLIDLCERFLLKS